MKKRLISTCILIAYSATLIKVMVFKDLPLIRIGSLIINFGGTQEGPANLVPFKTILPYLLGEKGFMIACINLFGNIILLVPIGFLVPSIYRNMIWKKTLAVAIATGFAIEGMQVLFRVGIFDVDDITLNALGVMVGYWAFTILAKKAPSVKSENRMITTVMVMLVAGMAAFYAVVVYQKIQPPARFRLRAANGQSDRFDNGKGGVPAAVISVQNQEKN